MGSENKENPTIVRTFRIQPIEKHIPTIITPDSDSDDSDGSINWRDYYGDDEQG